MNARIQTAGTPSLVSGVLTLLAGILTVLVLTGLKASADNLHWDSNGNTAGFGNTTGTWGTTAFWNDNSTGGTPTGAFTAITTSSDTVNFGTATLNYASGTIGVAAGGVAAGGIVIGAGQTTAITALGTSGNAITIHGGITKNAGSAAISFTSPITLGAAQTWTNNTAAGAAGLLEVADNVISPNVNFVTNGGFQLTIDGTGNTTIGRTNDISHISISGSGALVKNGTGYLQLGGNNNTVFSGNVTINGGIVGYGLSSGSLGTGNIEITNGVLEAYWTTGFTRTQGTGANEIRITGGVSGFSGSNNSTFNIGNIVWGSATFNPTQFVLNSAVTAAGNSSTFSSNIDLGGATRTIRSDQSPTSPTSGRGTFSGIISNGGIIKTGVGLHLFSGVNTYSGGTTIEDGTLQLGNNSALGSTSATLTVNGGLLNINNYTVSVGNLTGTGGTIGNNGNAARTLTIGNGGGTGGNFQGVIANNTNAGTGSLALTKTGAGTITLSGNNTYTGTTLISGGALQIGNGGTSGSLATPSVTNDATLIYDRSDVFSVGYFISGRGALIKRGGGTMSFASPVLTSDHITIAEGELKFLQANTANGAASMTIAETGASFNLHFSGTQTLGELFIGETRMPDGVYKAVGSPASGTELAQITGPGTLSVTGDIYPPALVSITSDIDTYAVSSGTAVTYTITFNEAIDISTVSAADFANAGSAPITVGAITEIAPGVFTVVLTPTGSGTLRLAIPSGATLSDLSGNALETGSGLSEDTSVPTYLSNDGLPQYIGNSPVATNVGSTITMEMPAGAQPGDLLIVNVINYATAGRSSISTAGTDWTTLKTGYLLNNNVNYRGGLYYREVLDGDGASFTLNLSSDQPGANFAAAGVILAFSNVDMVSGPLANASTAAVSSFKSVSAPTSAIESSYVYTNVPNALFVFLGMAIGDSAVNFSNWSNPPYGSNLTSGIDILNEIYDASGAPGLKTISLGAAMGTKEAMGLNYNGTADLTSAIHNAGIQVALRPTTNGPLLSALQQLKAHLTGQTPLSTSQIGAHLATIESNRFSFRSSIDSIAAAMDLVHTYDELLGPLWVARNMPNRGSLQNDIHHAVFKVMQHLLSYSFNTANLTSNYDLLNHFAYGSAANFPGSCAAPADPNQTHTLLINADYPNTWGRDVFGENEPARKPTGTYLAPGSIATVTAPQSLVGRGYLVRVGAHSWDMSEKTAIKRLDRCTVSYAINSTTMQVANPLGGGIYIEVPKYVSNVGVVSVQVRNAVRSPYFSAKSFHQTTLSEWQNIERHHSAPWADFQSEKVMMQVPTSWIYAMNDPVTLMADWDRAVDILNDLMGFPRNRGRETIYNQVDLQLREVAFTPGYPAVNNSYTPNQNHSGYANNYLVRGPQYAPDYEFHELGHAYKFAKFPGETESDVNLLHVPVFMGFGYSIDEAFRKSRSGPEYATLETTAIAWMMCDNFLNGAAGTIMEDFEKQYALKGHAKFVEIARLFGWERLGNYFYSFNADEENNMAIATDVESLLLRLSGKVAIDIRPLFHFWGVPPINSNSLGDSIQAANLPASRVIYDTLVRYKSLVPPDNATFRTFANGWWGKQPLSTGYSEERYHAARWDSYDPTMAAATAARAQAIIDLYFPTGRPSDYGDWRSQWAGVNLVDPQTDLDGDGMSNDHERIWGLDPTDAISRNPIHFNSSLKSGSFTYTRRNRTLTGLNYTVWTSPNLNDWTEDTEAQQTPGAPDANGVQTVEVALSPGLLVTPALFIRMRASE